MPIAQLAPSYPETEGCLGALDVMAQCCCDGAGGTAPVEIAPETRKASRVWTINLLRKADREAIETREATHTKRRLKASRVSGWVQGCNDGGGPATPTDALARRHSHATLAECDRSRRDPTTLASVQ